MTAKTAAKGDRFYPFVPTDEEIAALDADVTLANQRVETATKLAADAKDTLESIAGSGVEIFTFHVDGKLYKTRKRMMPAYLIRMKIHDPLYLLIDEQSNPLNDLERYDCDGAKFYSIPPCRY